MNQLIKKEQDQKFAHYVMNCVVSDINTLLEKIANIYPDTSCIEVSDKKDFDEYQQVIQDYLLVLDVVKNIFVENKDISQRCDEIKQSILQAFRFTTLEK
ncbi:MAG: hypothetical protein Tsb0014_35640 [Pleurocapsa sp.]